MAILTFGEASTDYADPPSFLDLDSLRPVVGVETSATLLDDFGFGINLTGTALTYAPAGITGGTVTGIDVFAPGGASIFTITGLSAGAAEVAADLSVGKLDIALLRGKDQVYGSSHGDIIAGGGGNDRLFGGGGRDIVAGMDGQDRMTGGAGGDFFVFNPNKGVDTIVDFTDTGGRQDDVIVVRRANFAEIVLVEDGNDLLIEFGTKGTLRILNQTAADLGADDFTFSLPF